MKMLARSFGIRWDEDLRRADGTPGAVVLGIEGQADRWYEAPLDHDQLIELIDELTRYAARYAKAGA